jgi:ligand-binding sensor domain-containing protein
LAKANILETTKREILPGAGFHFNTQELLKTIYLLLLLSSFMVSCRGQDATKTVGIDSTYKPEGDIISVALKDKAGNLWFVASDRGVYRYDGKSFINFTVKDGLCSNNVTCIYEDKTGTLWFGTDAGICRYDGKTFTSFSVAEAGSGPYPKNLKQVGCILQDKTGNFWFVTLNHGVYRYDGKSFTNFLPSQVLVCILEDKKGNIWVGSWSHGGVYRYDGKSFTNFNGLSDDMIKCMLEDKAGNIWIGTRDNGVDRYDGKSITNFSENDGLCSNDVSCIFEDNNGNLWFGSDFTEGGTKRGDAYFYNGKSFKNATANNVLTEKGGLPYTVMTIVEDNKSNLWFGSRGGFLFRYDGKSFTDFSEKVAKK